MCTGTTYKLLMEKPRIKPVGLNGVNAQISQSCYPHKSQVRLRSHFLIYIVTLECSKMKSFELELIMKMELATDEEATVDILTVKHFLSYKFSSKHLNDTVQIETSCFMCIVFCFFFYFGVLGHNRLGGNCLGYIGMAVLIVKCCQCFY